MCAICCQWIVRIRRTTLHICCILSNSRAVLIDLVCYSVNLLKSTENRWSGRLLGQRSLNRIKGDGWDETDQGHKTGSNVIYDVRGETSQQAYRMMMPFVSSGLRGGYPFCWRRNCSLDLDSH